MTGKVTHVNEKDTTFTVMAKRNACRHM